MTIASSLVFLIPVLSGSLLVHRLWPERSGSALLLKLALGVGLGLGVSSILYFLSLLIAPGRVNMLALQAGLLLALLILTILRERKPAWPGFADRSLSPVQLGLLGATLIALVFSGSVFLNLTKARPQGAFDAWSIWNRAARFIYRDPENWRATLSPDLYWGNHADYPLLVPLNVAWGWEVVGRETQRVPMVQSALFLFASIGVLYAGVGLTRTPAQASLASLVLMGTPLFLSMGSGLISDVPVTYYILSACVLLYLYLVLGRSTLLLLSGFMAGLAAWTKNEGLLYVVVSISALPFVSRKDMLRPLAWYLAGLAIPMAVVVYFKGWLAPAGDLFPGSDADLMVKITDLSRYELILKALQVQALEFAGWPISIFILLGLYALIVRLRPTSETARGAAAISAILLTQFLGYCAVYVLTPHDLGWHLGTSLGRLILQLYPAFIFLFFCLAVEPEKVFRRSPVAEA